MLAREMEVKEVNRKVERGRQLGRSSRVDESTQQEMYRASHLNQQSLMTDLTSGHKAHSNT